MLIVCCLRGLCVCVSVSLEYTTPSPILADNSGYLSSPVISKFGSAFRLTDTLFASELFHGSNLEALRTKFERDTVHDLRNMTFQWKALVENEVCSRWSVRGRAERGSPFSFIY